MFDILTGLPNNRRGSPSGLSMFRNTARGIFGRCASCFNVVEIQERGALHCHALIYGLFSVVFLDYIAENDELRKLVSDILDRIITCSFPQEVYDAYDANPSYQGGLELRFPVGREEQNRQAQRVGVHCQTHTHGFSCRKGPQGEYICRFGMPKEKNDVTECVQIEPTVEGKKVTSVRRKDTVDPKLLQYFNLLLLITLFV